MVEYEDECVGCPPEMGCLGKDGCPNMHVSHFYCDECGEEETLYQYNDKQLCKSCLMDYVLDDYSVVEGSDL